MVRTDHSSLEQLRNQHHTVAQQCWLSKQLGFDFTIEYKQGVHNRAADSLSRRDCNEQIPDNTVLAPSSNAPAVWAFRHQSHVG